MAQVPVATVFWVNAFAALLISAIIGWQLQTTTDENNSLNEIAVAQKQLYFSNAAVVLQRMRDFYDREIDRMRLATNQSRFLVAAAVVSDSRIRTSYGAFEALNETLFNAWAHRMLTAEELYGFGCNLLYPADVDDGFTGVQSIEAYADPLKTGERQRIYSYTPDIITAPDGLVWAYELATKSAPSLGAYVELTNNVAYTFDYVASSAIGVNQSSYFNFVAWQASDGNPYWFLQQSSWMKAHGVNIVIQTYETTVAWQEQLTALLSSKLDNFVLIDGTRTVVATSYVPEIARRALCVSNNTGVDISTCFALPMENHTLSLFRYFARTVLPRADDASYFAPVSSTASNGIKFAVSTFEGTSIGLVYGSMSRVEGPASAQLEVLWFTFNPAIAQPSPHNAQAVPVLIAAMIIVAIGSTIGVWTLIHGTFVRPMQTLGAQMVAVTELNTGALATISTASYQGALQFTEIAKMRLAFAKMAASIQWFTLYLPADVVKDLMIHAEDNEEQLAARNELVERQLTVLFADIRGFTAATAALRGQPDLFVELLQMYFEQCSNALTDQGCTIDKYIGDAIMGFWGAPLLCPDQEERACAGALQLASAVERLRSHFMDHGWDLAVRVGLHSGASMVGSIGSKRRLNYTALGETVNMSSRLEGLCKYTNTTILVSHTIVEAAPESATRFVYRRVGTFVLKGADEAITAYMLAGVPEGAVNAHGPAHVTVEPALPGSIHHQEVNKSAAEVHTHEGSVHSIHLDRSSLRGSDHTCSPAQNPSSKSDTSRQRYKHARRTDFVGLSPRFLVSPDVEARIDTVNAAEAHYDAGKPLRALQLIVAAIARCEAHTPGSESDQPFSYAGVGRGDLEALHTKYRVAVDAGEAFNPVIVMQDK